MTGKLVCHCFGVSDERRRTGIHTDLFSGNPLLGILNVDALRGVTDKEAQAFRTIGIECVRDLAAIDPSTLLSAMPVSPWRIMQVKRLAELLVSVRPEPEIVRSIGGLKIADAIAMDTPSLVRALGSDRSVLGGTLTDLATLQLCLVDSLLQNTPIATLCLLPLSCIDFNVEDSVRMRGIAKLMREAAEALAEGDLEKAKRLQEEALRRLDALIKENEDADGGDTTPDDGSSTPAKPKPNPLPIPKDPVKLQKWQDDFEAEIYYIHAIRDVLKRARAKDIDKLRNELDQKRVTVDVTKFDQATKDKLKKLIDETLNAIK